MPKQHDYYVYIISNEYNRVLYTGVTNSIVRRTAEHKNKRNPKSFSSKYNCAKLVYFEHHKYILNAIAREKQLKAGSRARKLRLIDGLNPCWKDLSEGWYEGEDEVFD